MRKLALLLGLLMASGIACSLGADLDDLSSGNGPGSSDASPDVLTGAMPPPPPASSDDGGADAGDASDGDVPLCERIPTGAQRFVCDDFSGPSFSAEWSGLEVDLNYASIRIVQEEGRFRLGGNAPDCSYAQLLKEPNSGSAAKMHARLRVYTDNEDTGALPAYLLILGLTPISGNCDLLVGGDADGTYALEQSMRPGVGDGGKYQRPFNSLAPFPEGVWVQLDVDVDFASGTFEVRLDGERVLMETLSDRCRGLSGRPRVRVGYHCQPSRPQVAGLSVDDVLVYTE